MTRSKPKATAEAPKAEAPPAEKAKGFEEVKARVSKPATTGDTVTVGCKTPNGILLVIQETVSVDVPVLGGGFKTVKENRPNPEAPNFTLNGTATPFGEQPRCLVVAGYAMTPGIPKDFMAIWMEQNKNLDMVKAGLIIVQDTTDKARAQAKEQHEKRSGLEPLNVGKGKTDPRTPKRLDGKTGRVVDALEVGDEQPVTRAA